MAIYPKQLQLYPEHSYSGTIGERIREKAPGNHVVYADSFSPPSALTVNDVLAEIGSNLYGEDPAGITSVKRTRPELRPLQSDFGSTVVYPASTPISGAKSVNQVIEAMRVLWDTNRAVDSDGIGYATSVQN